MQAYLGVDVGSISTNLVALSEEKDVLGTVYLRTAGNPINAIKEGMAQLAEQLAVDVEICGAATTGSARQLASAVVGGDLCKNEITAHAISASHYYPDVRTVLEIGGQDSKIIILNNGVVTDFAMNTVCAAGTGSFLDQQASRLNIPIEEFGGLALQADSPVRIAGRCTVFAESDMIHKQQLGYGTEDIIAGLCQALVRNYLNNLGKGKEIHSPVIFQGGVAANKGIKYAFEEALQQEILIPEHFKVMGALGAALLAREKMAREQEASKFKGFNLGSFHYKVDSFECNRCPNHCEILKINENGRTIACWGSRCGHWSYLAEEVS